MRCYRLEKSRIRRGIPAHLFPVGNAVTRKGLVVDAAVSFILPAGTDDQLFKEGLAEHGGMCHQFGEAWLRAPRSSQPRQDLLVVLDWREYRPDPDIGDESVLVTWRGPMALYACPAGRTFMRQRRGGNIITNDNGELQAILPEAYGRLRAERLRAGAAQGADTGRRLDYLLE